MSNPTAVKRTVWMTPSQRMMVWKMLDAALKSNPNHEDRAAIISIIKELDIVQKRERISGRLVQNHVTGLRLPHDALPVKITDDEALTILKFKIDDKVLRRMLKPGPVKQGRR